MFDPKAHKASKIKAYYAKKTREQKAAVVYTADADDPLTRVVTSLAIRANKELSARGVKRNQSHMQLIGCNRAFLRRHLESKFEDGMAWENYGDWQVDHVAS